MFLAERDSAIDPDSLADLGLAVPSLFGSTTVVFVITTASSTAVPYPWYPYPYGYW